MSNMMYRRISDSPETMQPEKNGGAPEKKPACRRGRKPAVWVAVILLLLAAALSIHPLMSLGYDVEHTDGLLCRIVGHSLEVGADDEIVIPDRLYYMTVTDIGDGAFADLHSGKVILPDSVSGIGKNAFGAGVTLCGADGSLAQYYAQQNGLAFEIR